MTHAAQALDPLTQAAQRIVGLYTELSKQTDLTQDNPHLKPILDALDQLVKSALVEPALEGLEAHPLLQPILPDLQNRYAVAEGEMEKDFARRLLRDEAGMLSLHAHFPYHAAYRNQIRAELDLLAAGPAFAPQSRIIFLGAGAIPLSALLIAEAGDWPLTLVDRDVEAVELARAILARFGLGEQVDVAQAEAGDIDFSAHDLIWMAALLRDYRKVLACLDRLETRPPILMRGTERASRIIYASPDHADFRAAGYRQSGDTGQSAKFVTGYLYLPN